MPEESLIVNYSSCNNQYKLNVLIYSRVTALLAFQTKDKIKKIKIRHTEFMASTLKRAFSCSEKGENVGLTNHVPSM